MREDDARSAAEFLLQARSSGSKISDIPEAFRPKAVDDGYEIQEALLLLLDEPGAGWFVALTSSEMQHIHRANEPIYGRILKSNVRQPGEIVLSGDAAIVSVEAEIAFRFNKVVVPRVREYSVDEIAAAVGSVAPVIELVDSRFIDMTAIPLASLISDNGTDGYIVIGNEIRFSPGSGSPHEMINLSIDGHHRSKGNTMKALGDPLRACAWLANRFGKIGRTIHPGEIVVTGNCLDKYCFASGGQTLRAEFGALGTVIARLANGRYSGKEITN